MIISIITILSLCSCENIARRVASKASKGAAKESVEKVGKEAAEAASKKVAKEVSEEAAEVTAGSETEGGSASHRADGAAKHPPVAMV